MKRGLRIPWKVPVEETIHLYPYRYKLNLSEMKQYPVVLLSHIGVVSNEVLAQYLVMGGFVIGADLPTLQEHLSQIGESAEIVKIELGHPLFHDFFDVTEYRKGGGLSCGRATGRLADSQPSGSHTNGTSLQSGATLSFQPVVRKHHCIRFDSAQPNGRPVYLRKIGSTRCRPSGNCRV